MSIITILWSTAAAACLTIGTINLFIWFRLKQSKANFLFSLAAHHIIYEYLRITAKANPEKELELKQEMLDIEH